MLSRRPRLQERVLWNATALVVAIIVSFWISTIAAAVFDFGHVETDYDSIGTAAVEIVVTTATAGLVYTALLSMGAVLIALLCAVATRFGVRGLPLRALAIAVSPIVVLPTIAIGAGPDDADDWLFYLGAGLMFALLMRLPPVDVTRSEDQYLENAA